MQPIKLYSHPIGPNPWKVAIILSILQLPYETIFSGAIVNYLTETYEPSHQLSYDAFPERHQLQQWLHFQVSGQGPYYGQLGRVTLAIERYTEEIRRVMGCTYADLCFVPWQELVPFIIGDKELVQHLLEQHPNVQVWMDRMKAMPEVRNVLQEKSDAMSMAMQ
ncbi:hypothetical protein BDV09DRAFT_190143 [Aspergillus tetrazonus]